MLQLLIIIFILYIIYKVYQQYTCGVYNGDTKMTGKLVIVTGANTGIGFTTAEDIARRGAKVNLACRDEKKGMDATNQIIRSTGNDKVIFKPLDLSSFQSVRDFAEDIIKTETKLDVLINNAGTGNLDNALTADNLPIEAQVNYFSPYLLTMLLLPLLKSSAPSRIVNVSSVMHYIGTIDKLEKQAKNSFQLRRVYSNTKLANILFTKKLSEVLKGTGVTANSLHPGAVNTEIFRGKPALVRLLLRFLFKTCVEGAQTSIYLAVAPELESVTGKYFSDCAEKQPANKAQDEEAANNLWEMTQDIIKRKKLI